MPPDHKIFRRELQRLKEHSENTHLIELVDRLLSELDREREESRRRFDRYAESLRSLDRRVLMIENSRIFRTLQRVTAVLRGWQRRAGIRTRIESAEDERQYQTWIEQEAARTPSHAAVVEAARGFAYRPVISVLMHVDQCEREWLERAITSVQQQSWNEWELCICDDASGESWLKGYLDSLQRANPRIRVVRTAERTGAASSLNRAGILASGDYFAILNQHDTLSAHALFQIVEALQTQKYGLLYGDEDRLDNSGARRSPVFKPDWSPELLTSSMYLGRFAVVSRAAMDALE